MYKAVMYHQVGKTQLLEKCIVHKMVGLGKYFGSIGSGQ